MKSIKLLHVRSGAACTIYALAYPREGSVPDPCPALAFLKAQSGSVSELFKITALLTKTAESGPPEDETKFRRLEGSDELYEFKTSGGLRLLCFRDGVKIIVCTHGVMKLTKKRFQGEMRAAENARCKYFQAKDGKTLLYGPKPK